MCGLSLKGKDSVPFYEKLVIADVAELIAQGRHQSYLLLFEENLMKELLQRCHHFYQQNTIIKSS